MKSTYTYEFECSDEDGGRFTTDLFRNHEYGKAMQNLTVLDVGAHVGIFSTYIHNFAQEVYAIEPYGVNYQNLLQNIAVNNLTRVKPYNIGLWNTTGTIQFEPRSSGGGQSGYGRDTINVMTLYDFVHTYNVPPIDLMKLDTEGAEQNILMEPKSRYIVQSIPRICMEHGNGQIDEYLKSLGFTKDMGGAITFFYK